MARPPAAVVTAVALLVASAAAAPAPDGDQAIAGLLKKTSSLFPHPRIGRSGAQWGQSGVGNRGAAGQLQFAPGVGFFGNPANVEKMTRLARDYSAHSGDHLESLQPASMVEQYKRKGLMAFPRVGRTDGFPLGVSSRMGPVGKRLFPHPRIGRGGGPNDGGAQQSLWFGPRVGRRDRRSLHMRPQRVAADDGYNGKESAPNSDFTPRLGRESEEEQMALAWIAAGDEDDDVDGYER